MFETEKKTALKAVQEECTRRKLRLLFLYVSGSIAYGVNTPDSDIDIRGVYLDTKESLLGLDKQNKGFVTPVYDTTIHPLKKVVQMLSKCNPNIIEMLGLRKEDIIYCDPLFQPILDNAHLFLSKTALAASTQGFVNSEMNRIRTENDDMVSITDKMYHVIRLLGMSTDILIQQNVAAYREKEHDLLMNIRRCQKEGITPDTVFIEAYERMKDGFQCALAMTELPDEPDTEAINELLIGIYRKAYIDRKQRKRKIEI